MKAKTKLKLIIVFITIWLAGSKTSFAQQNIQKDINPTSMTFPDGAQFKNANLTYKLTPSIENTWGYCILKDKKVIVNQPNVPGRPGDKGFETSEDAKKVAMMAIEKLKQGIMPPSISKEDMLQAGIVLKN